MAKFKYNFHLNPHFTNGEPWQNNTGRWVLSKKNGKMALCLQHCHYDRKPEIPLSYNVEAARVEFPSVDIVGIPKDDEYPGWEESWV